MGYTTEIKARMIYLIDDDDVYQYTFVKALGEYVNPDEVKVFTDGEEALAFIQANIQVPDVLPNVIFLDINMPLMDGWDFMDCFTSLKAELPVETRIYMVSSSIDTADVERAKSLQHVADYLIKPIDLDHLERIINQS